MEDLNGMAELGILPGIDAHGWFAATFDPRADFSDTIEIDTWIREDAQGIHLRRHPESALRDDPQLWEFISQWRSGLWHDTLTLADWQSLSAWQIDAILYAQAAHAREEKRRIDDARNKPEGVADD